MTSGFAANEEHETIRELAKDPKGRARLVPFSAMLAIGVVVTLAWRALQT